MKENVINQADALIDEATGSGRHRKMVEIFDELSDSLCRVADMAEFIRLAHPKAAYSHAAEDACISVSGVVEKYWSQNGIVIVRCYIEFFGLFV